MKISTKPCLVQSLLFGVERNGLKSKDQLEDEKESSDALTETDLFRFTY